MKYFVTTQERYVTVTYSDVIGFSPFERKIYRSNPAPTNRNGGFSHDFEYQGSL
jgi:hypothetical protein